MMIVHALSNIIHSTYLVQYIEKERRGKVEYEYTIFRYGVDPLRFSSAYSEGVTYLRTEHNGFGFTVDGENRIPLGHLLTEPFVYYIAEDKKGKPIFFANQTVVLLDGKPIYLVHVRKKNANYLNAIEISDYIDPDDVEKAEEVLLEYYRQYVSEVRRIMKNISDLGEVYTSAAISVANDLGDKLAETLYRHITISDPRKASKDFVIGGRSKYSLIGAKYNHAIILGKDVVYVGKKGIIATNVNSETIKNKKCVLFFTPDTVLISYPAKGDKSSIYDITTGEELLETPYKSPYYIYRLGLKDDILSVIYFDKGKYIYYIKDLKTGEEEEIPFEKPVPISFPARENNDIVFYGIVENKVERIPLEDLLDIEFDEDLYEDLNLRYPTRLETYDTRKEVVVIPDSSGGILTYMPDKSAKFSLNETLREFNIGVADGRKVALVSTNSRVFHDVIFEEVESFKDLLLDFIASI